MNGFPDQKWIINQVSGWLALQYPQYVRRAELCLLKSRMATIDSHLPYTKDLEEMCWSEVERMIRTKLQKTAIEVANKAKISPNRFLQDAIHESLAVRTL